MSETAFDPNWREKGFAHCMYLAQADTVQDAVMAFLGLVDTLERAAEHDLHARRILGQVRAYLRRRAGFLGDIQ
jgi:hypothetical protein